jgi:hypothetical protein
VACSKRGIAVLLERDNLVGATVVIREIASREVVIAVLEGGISVTAMLGRATEARIVEAETA